MKLIIIYLVDGWNIVNIKAHNYIKNIGAHIVMRKDIFLKGAVKKMNSFRIKNIKSFSDSGKIELKPITIFVGKNSCGKSSLLRFPIILSQTATANTDSPLMFYGKMIDYGNYEDVINGRKEGSIEFEIHYDINIADLQDARFRMLDDSNQEDEKVEMADAWMRVIIGKKDKKMLVETVELYIKDKMLSGFYYEDNGYRVDLLYLYNNGNVINRKCSIRMESVEFETFFPFYDARERFSAIAGLVMNKSQEHLDEASGQELYNDIYNNANPFGIDQLSEDELNIKLISDGFDYASTIMSQIYNRYQIEAITTTYIGPFRQNPERVYRDNETQSRDVGVKGENVSTLLIRDYHKDNNLINAISKWLYTTMGYKLTIKDMGSNLFQIMLVNNEGLESNILDVGFGISQILPIVTQIIKSSSEIQRTFLGRATNEENIYIEQPELHLHPAAQADLADLFVNCVNECKNKRVIIETHSEHLIRKLQVLIADKNNPVTSDMVKIYYVDKDSKGIAKVSEMKILDSGKFEKKWPSGFFDKAHELSMELLKYSSVK